MKSLFRLVTFFITILFLNGCLPEGDKTISLVSIPEPFFEEWNLCFNHSSNEYDAIKAPLIVTQKNSFSATSSGKDYYGSNITIQFDAFYNLVSDSITGKIQLTKPNDHSYKRDFTFGLLWSTYQSEYVKLTEKTSPANPLDQLDQMRILFKHRLQH